MACTAPNKRLELSTFRQGLHAMLFSGDPVWRLLRMKALLHSGLDRAKRLGLLFLSSGLLEGFVFTAAKSLNEENDKIIENKIIVDN